MSVIKMQIETNRQTCDPDTIIDKMMIAWFQEFDGITIKIDKTILKYHHL